MNLYAQPDTNVEHVCRTIGSGLLFRLRMKVSTKHQILLLTKHQIDTIFLSTTNHVETY